MTDSKEPEGAIKRRNLLTLLGLSAAVAYTAPVLTNLAPAAAQPRATRASRATPPTRMTRPTRVTRPSR